MSSYRPAPEAADIARQLIADTPSHKGLATVPIAYLYVDPPAKNKGREKWGSARLVSGLAAWLAEPVSDAEGTIHEEVGSFFVIELAEKLFPIITDQQRIALIDHELSHCVVDDDDTYRIRPHDLEEFTDVVKRHGLWNTGLFDFVQAGAEQLRFPDTPPDDTPPEPPKKGKK